jgi:putative membrane protein
MIKYNPKSWFSLIFRFHKAETFSQLKWMLFSIALFALIVVYVERTYLPALIGSHTVHSLLGFVIGLLLVFRTNTAYDRWWEGRKQWGALVNVSRNFALKLKANSQSGKILDELLALDAAYSNVLRGHLRLQQPRLLLKHVPDFIDTDIKAEHIPNYLAGEMQRRLKKLADQAQWDTAIYLSLLADLDKFTDICGACERIRKTPIPYTYNIFLKKFIFAYIITMPFAFVATFGYWTALVTVFTFYTFASLELIAEEIEDPFGEDSNDLPTDGLAKTIAKNIKEL